MSNHSMGLTHPRYRADIDGLRAIAVLAVVVFHAFPSLLGGGFIGVDIFFVISGFLISTIIFENLDRDRFSFIEFYSRRIKRIFPALIIVLLACYAVGWMMLTAPDFKRLGRHIAGGTVFLSNFLLLRESGYFDTAAEVKPMLHLWSLAIEEQFYILWPFLVWCATQLRLNRMILIVLIGVLSFLSAIHASHDSDSVAWLYYSPQTRFWELVSGALLAYCTMGNLFQKVPWFSSKDAFADIRSFMGAAFLVAGFLFIDKDTPFPGWYALLPVLGAALIISAGAKAWINRQILSSRVLVWFGLISFPLYLWHWPLLSFARILQAGTPDVTTRLSLVCLSVVLAWLTKQYIEKPIRFDEVLAGSRYTTAGLLIFITAVGGVGYYTFMHHGLSTRYGVAELKIEPGRYECDEMKQNSGCVFGNQHASKLVVVWGDSHAEQYTNALRLSLSQEYEFIAITNGSCFMGEKVTFPHIGNQHDCNAALARIRALRGQTIYAVIRVQRWHGYGISAKQDVENAVNDAITAYDLKPQKIIVMGATPDVDIDCELSNYYKRAQAGKKKCGAMEDIKAEVKQFIAITKMMQEPANVRFLYPYEIVCPNDSCAVIKNNIAYFEDRHHLSTDGALKVVPYIAALLAEDGEGGT